VKKSCDENETKWRIKMKKYCFGIDVGGTTVKMGLFTTEGELLDKWEIPTRKEDGGAYILNDVAASVEAKLAEKNIEKDDVAGAGIGVPGPTLDTGYVSICVNLGWKDKNPANELSELLSIPVKAGNDANVAALGEMWKGGGEGYLDVVLLTLGTGVGGGIIINGEIAPSHRGVGGELGHITVNPDEEATCNCGNHGCLEQYASATGIVRLAKRRLEADTKDSVLRQGEVSAKTVFDAVKAGDRVLVIDDLLATGGTAVAACNLVKKAGADVVASAFIIELDPLKGREKIEASGVNVVSMLNYDLD